jgi:hypothetical protein
VVASSGIVKTWGVTAAGSGLLQRVSASPASSTVSPPPICSADALWVARGTGGRHSTLLLPCVRNWPGYSWWRSRLQWRRRPATTTHPIPKHCLAQDQMSQEDGTAKRGICRTKRPNAIGRSNSAVRLGSPISPETRHLG